MRQRSNRQTVNENGLQNRFTAYLMAAVRNKRITYMEKKRCVRVSECGGMELLSKGYMDFEQEYCNYRNEVSSSQHNQEFDLQELMKDLEERKLAKALMGLKKREQEILMDRVFLEQDFADIALAHELTAKQAEMAYYYIIRKLRKELEGKRYD